MKNVIVVTGASSGFGALSCTCPGSCGSHCLCHHARNNRPQLTQVKEVKEYIVTHSVDLHSIELDVLSQESTDGALKTIISENGHIDVVVHNAGHMVFGPAEAFTAEQLAQLYDINVLSTQRVNRAVLPHLRLQRKGLIVWVSSSSTRGGTPPYLAPYFAAKAAMDALAVSYASELTRWGIETSIIVPGSFTSGTNHFKNAGSPNDKTRVQNTTLECIRDYLIRSRRALTPICRRTRMLALSLMPLSRLSTCHLVSDLSAYTSTLLRMALK